MCPAATDKPDASNIQDFRGEPSVSYTLLVARALRLSRSRENSTKKYFKRFFTIALLSTPNTVTFSPSTFSDVVNFGKMERAGIAGTIGAFAQTNCLPFATQVKFVPALTIFWPTFLQGLPSRPVAAEAVPEITKRNGKIIAIPRAHFLRHFTYSGYC